MLAPDGRTVFFQSFASDLMAGDYNNERDIFVLRLSMKDSDNDGMDDDWEVAYFGNLSRDGTGDFDGDGMTDLAEFVAGTDPTNQGSVLKVMTLNPLNLPGTRVLWSAEPGKRYQVQFKNSISDPGWIDLASPVVASITTGSVVDSSNGLSAQRFYRVVLMP